MKKLLRDGHIAILISRGFGAGWYSWHGIEKLLYDPNIVRMLENPDENEDRFTIERYCEETYGDDSYYGGIDGLQVVWLPEGTQFLIHEYDGAESIWIKEKLAWKTA